MKVFAIFIVALFAIQAVAANVADEIPELGAIDTLEDGTIQAMFCWRRFAKQTRQFVKDSKALVEKFEKCSGKNILPFGGEGEDGTISQMLCWRGFVKQARALIEDGKDVIRQFENCKTKSGDKLDDGVESDGVIGNILCWRKIAKQTKAFIESVKDLVNQFEKCIGKGKVLNEIENEETDSTIGTILCWRKFTKKLKALISDAKELFGGVKRCAGKALADDDVDMNETDFDLNAKADVRNVDDIVIDANNVEEILACWKNLGKRTIKDVVGGALMYLEFRQFLQKVMRGYQNCDNNYPLSSPPTNLEIQKRRACFTAWKATTAAGALIWRNRFMKVLAEAYDINQNFTDCLEITFPLPIPKQLNKYVEDDIIE